MSYTLLAPGATGNTFAGSYALQTVINTATWTGTAGDGLWNNTSDNWSGPAGSKFFDGQPVVFDDTGAAAPNITVNGSGPWPPIRSTPGITFNSTTSYTLTSNDNTNQGINILTLDNGTLAATIHAIKGSHTLAGGLKTYSNVDITADSGAGITITTPAGVNYYPSSHNPFTGRNVTLNGAGAIQILWGGDNNGIAGDAGDINGNFTAVGTGRYVLGSAATTGYRAFAGNLAVDSGATLVLTAAGSGANGRVFTKNSITGPGAVAIEGPGSVMFGNDRANNTSIHAGETFNGLTVRSGELVIGGNNGTDGSVISGGVITGGSLGVGTVTLQTGTTLTFQNWQPAYIANNLVLSGTVSISGAGNGLYFTNHDAANSTMTIQPTFTLVGDTDLFSLPNTSFGGGRVAIENPIVGAHSLTIDGPNPLRLGSNGSTYSGGTILNTGNVEFTNTPAPVISGGALVSSNLGTGPLTLSGGTIQPPSTQMNNNTFPIANATTINGPVTIGNGSNGYVKSSVIIDSSALNTPHNFTFAGNPTVTVATNGINSDLGLIVHDHVVGTGFTKAGTGYMELNNLPDNQAIAVSGGTLRLRTLGTKDVVNVISSLTLSGGVMDIGNQDLLVHNPVTASATTLLTSASTGALGAPAAVGTLTGAQFLALYGPSAKFDGATVVAGDTLYKFTYAGDTTLKGYVDATDFAQIDASWLKVAGGATNSGFSWLQGDFDRDGTITTNDFALIDAAFTHQNGTLAAGIVAGDLARFAGTNFAAQYQAALGVAGTVPEPASLGLLAISAMGLLGRRRR
ncbi:MAG: PEP-CTERM sorting domain-containing protein [Phycisphaerae bacterium]